MNCTFNEKSKTVSIPPEILDLKVLSCILSVYRTISGIHDLWGSKTNGLLVACKSCPILHSDMVQIPQSRFLQLALPPGCLMSEEVTVTRPKQPGNISRSPYSCQLPTEGVGLAGIPEEGTCIAKHGVIYTISLVNTIS